MDEIERAREVIRTLWADFAPTVPFWVKFSGGKDSTLLLQLTLAVAAENRFRRIIFVEFNDTRLDFPCKYSLIKGLIPRISSVHPNVSFLVTSPPPERTLFSFILGRGYNAPDWMFRYCTKELKVTPSRKRQRAAADEFGGLLTLSGERKEESGKRLRRLTEQGAPDGLKLERRRPSPIFTASPIADVSTESVWKYLEKQGRFIWGETVEELRELYLQNGKIGANQRDGCWCCTVAAESKFSDYETPRGRIRNFLRLINDDPRRRCLAITDRQKKRLEEGKASGRLTLEARKEFYNFIKEQEKEAGERFLSPEEESFIFDCWKKEEEKETEE